MAAVGEFTARNTGEGCAEEFAADQLAHELHLTVTSAAAQMDYARTVTSRLAATYAALHAVGIHPVHVRIIEDETRVLSAKDAAKADAVLAEAAGRLTFGKLRADRAPPGPGTGPRIRRAPQGDRQAGRARAPVPGGIRQCRDGRPRTPAG